jgi:hypothetical protein
MSFNNGRPKPGPKFAPPQHVIEQYTHRTQEVRCICGWAGSSATTGLGPSEWTRHVTEFRTTVRR